LIDYELDEVEIDETLLIDVSVDVLELQIHDDEVDEVDIWVVDDVDEAELL